MMKKFTDADPEARSEDIVTTNVEQLRALFPEAFTEGKVDFDVLKQLLGGQVDEREEKYGLNWHGKRLARQLALNPSTGTLRPCFEESVDWEKTKNLMIEGDNLEVLKLLQKSYAGRVKLIYIDPPYNSGEDFVYQDDFQDNIRNYLELTGQLGEAGRRLQSNPETGGRFHTNWLNMMYPRLRVSRALLRKDGVIFVSVDDKEIANLRLVCDEIFGPENFIAEMVWEGANKNDARQIGVSHEYVVLYAKDRQSLPREWSLKKAGVASVLREVERLKTVHKKDFDAASTDLAGWFRSMKAKPEFALRRFRYIDQRGAYKEDDPTAPGGRKIELLNPRTGKVIPLRKNRGWSFDQAEFDKLVEEGRISFVTESSVMVRRYLHETDALTPQSVIYQPARSASERLAKLMGGNVFDFPKDETIIQSFIEMASDPHDNECVVMDFFAGSGTTGHAVLAQNAADGGTRRYVLVQLPEVLDPANEAQRSAADYCKRLGKALNLAELTKERLRRAGQTIDESSGVDRGFRLFKLDSTNIQEWNSATKNLQGSLQSSIDHLKTDRSDSDILYEMLVKLGLDPCVPIERRAVGGKDVHSIGAGVVIACLAERISSDELEALAQGIVEWHKELSPAGDTTCVFRDGAFGDDVAKTNLAAILQQNGLTNVRSL